MLTSGHIGRVDSLPEASLAAQNSLDGSKILTIRRIATLIAATAPAAAGGLGSKNGKGPKSQMPCRASQARSVGPLFYTPKSAPGLPPHDLS